MFKHKTVFIWLLIVTVTFTGVFLNRNLLENVNAGENEHYQRIKTFADTLSLVKRHYVEEVDAKGLVYGAI